MTVTRPWQIPHSALHLVIVGSEVRRCPLPLSGEIVIGRAPECDLVIDDDTVSRRHAILTLGAGGLAIRDLGSVNGTCVRGIAITGVPLALQLDDCIRIGHVTAMVQAASPKKLDVTPPVALASPMERVRALVDRIAAGSISVLLLGETGVGKEVLAEAVHMRSTRAAQPFLRLNCAALSETLLESELFGHERGSFTGAAQQKLGLLETAHGGTVFLDEIGELPMTTQVKLLRVIEQREVTRVGALAPRPIDVRFVAATHRDPAAEIAAGRFRQDLYFRLNGITIRIPPLRDRLGELEPLAAVFVTRAAAELGCAPPAFTHDAVAAMRAHTWPGNIRELRNVIDRAVLLANGNAIHAEHIVLDGGVAPTVEAVFEPATDLRKHTAAVEREQIIAALARAAGNQKVAAEMLGISRRTLINKLETYAIARPRKARSA